MKRSTILGGLLGAAVLTPTLGARAFAALPGRVTHSDEQWKQMLSPDAYDVLRREGTERPFSSPLDEEKHAGIYECAGCSLPAYSSTTKYDSGTGWPSFWKPLPNAVSTKSDTRYMEERTEVHCARCESHLGHVFDDGPKPTGLRYCMNGVALKFVPGRTAA